jgi:hypothetical protein
MEVPMAIQLTMARLALLEPMRNQQALLSAELSMLK